MEFLILGILKTTRGNPHCDIFLIIRNKCYPTKGKSLTFNLKLNYKTYRINWKRQLPDWNIVLSNLDWLVICRILHVSVRYYCMFINISKLKYVEINSRDIKYSYTGVQSQSTRRFKKSWGFFEVTVVFSRHNYIGFQKKIAPF